MVWALVLAAVAAVFVVLTTAMALRRAGQKDAAQSELIKAKDRQLAFDLAEKDVKIAEAQRGANEATENTARLTKENLLLQTDVLTLQQRLAPRRLDADAIRRVSLAGLPFRGSQC